MCQNIEELEEKYSDFVVQYEDFQIGKNIGKGGFSEVFLAVHSKTGQTVAVKKLKFKNLSDDRFQLYDREIEILAACSNKFLLGFIGFTVKRPFIIVTEFIPNGSLFDALRWGDDHKPLTGTQKTLIALGCASGMQRLHKIGIVHRDLKSLNILLDKDYLPRICDFGLSRFVESEKDELMTTNVGTPHWMAPELFESSKYTDKVDVYAYGMLLWEILTDSSPFKGKTAVQIAFDVCKKQKRPSIPMRTPSELKELINACWAQDPEKRPSFKKIYKVLSTGKICFAGTNKDELMEAIGRIKAEEKARRLQTHGRSGGSNGNRRKGSQGQNEADEEPAKVRFEVLSDITAKGFESALSEAVAKLPPEEASKFFECVGNHFSEESPEKNLLLLLVATEKLISADHSFYNAFIEKKLYEKIVLKKPGLADGVLGVMLHVFTKNPGLVSEAMLEGAVRFASISPQKVLRLLNLYSCHQPPQKHFWTAADALITNAEVFVHSGAGPQLLVVLYTLCSLMPEFRIEREGYIVDRLRIMIDEGGDDAKAALDFLCASEEGIQYQIDGATLTRAVSDSDREIRERAVGAICRMPGLEPGENLLRALLNAAESMELASLCLCELCGRVSTAVSVASMGGQWLNSHLPNLEGTLRLLMVVLRVPQARPRVPIEVGSLLIAVARDGRPELLRAVAPVVQRIELTPRMHSTLGGEFLEAYYGAIIGCEDTDAVAASFTVTDAFARVGFVPGFKAIVPLLSTMVASPNGWEPYAASALAALSVFPELKADLEENGIPESMSKLGGEIAPFREVFLKNMNK